MVTRDVENWILVAFVIASGCGPKNDPIDPVDETTSTTSASTGTPDPTTSGGTSSSADGSTTLPPTTGDGTTGEVDPICGSFCDKLFECGLDGAFEGCPCFGAEADGPKCAEAWQMTVDCFETATCDEINTGEGPCWDSFMASYEQCSFGEDGCEVFILGGTDEPPGDCTFGEECLDMPEKVVQCVADTCTCTIGDTEVGTCPADNVCRDFEALDAKVAECCAP